MITMAPSGPRPVSMDMYTSGELLAFTNDSSKLSLNSSWGEIRKLLLSLYQADMMQMQFPEPFIQKLQEALKQVQGFQSDVAKFWNNTNMDINSVDSKQQKLSREIWNFLSKTATEESNIKNFMYDLGVHGVDTGFFNSIPTTHSPSPVIAVPASPRHEMGAASPSPGSPPPSPRITISPPGSPGLPSPGSPGALKRPGHAFRRDGSWLTMPTTASSVLSTTNISAPLPPSSPIRRPTTPTTVPLPSGPSSNSSSSMVPPSIQTLPPSPKSLRIVSPSASSSASAPTVSVQEKWKSKEQPLRYFLDAIKPNGELSDRTVTHESSVPADAELGMAGRFAASGRLVVVSNTELRKNLKPLYLLAALEGTVPSGLADVSATQENIDVLIKSFAEEPFSLKSDQLLSLAASMQEIATLDRLSQESYKALMGMLSVAQQQEVLLAQRKLYLNDMLKGASRQNFTDFVFALPQGNVEPKIMSVHLTLEFLRQLNIPGYVKEVNRLIGYFTESTAITSVDFIDPPNIDLTSYLKSWFAEAEGRQNLDSVKKFIAKAVFPYLQNNQEGQALAQVFLPFIDDPWVRLKKMIIRTNGLGQPDITGKELAAFIVAEPSVKPLHIQSILIGVLADTKLTTLDQCLYVVNTALVPRIEIANLAALTSAQRSLFINNFANYYGFKNLLNYARSSDAKLDADSKQLAYQKCWLRAVELHEKKTEAKTPGAIKALEGPWRAFFKDEVSTYSKTLHMSFVDILLPEGTWDQKAMDALQDEKSFQSQLKLVIDGLVAEPSTTQLPNNQVIALCQALSLPENFESLVSHCYSIPALSLPDKILFYAKIAKKTNFPQEARDSLILRGTHYVQDSTVAEAVEFREKLSLIDPSSADSIQQVINTKVASLNNLNNLCVFITPVERSQIAPLPPGNAPASLAVIGRACKQALAEIRVLEALSKKGKIAIGEVTLTPNEEGVKKKLEPKQEQVDLNRAILYKLESTELGKILNVEIGQNAVEINAAKSRVLKVLLQYHKALGFSDLKGYLEKQQYALEDAAGMDKSWFKGLKRFVSSLFRRQLPLLPNDNIKRAFDGHYAGISTSRSATPLPTATLPVATMQPPGGTAQIVAEVLGGGAPTSTVSPSSSSSSAQSQTILDRNLKRACLMFNFHQFTRPVLTTKDIEEVLSVMVGPKPQAMGHTESLLRNVFDNASTSWLNKSLELSSEQRAEYMESKEILHKDWSVDEKNFFDTYVSSPEVLAAMNARVASAAPTPASSTPPASPRASSQ